MFILFFHWPIYYGPIIVAQERVKKKNAIKIALTKTIDSKEQQQKKK